MNIHETKYIKVNFENQQDKEREKIMTDYLDYPIDVLYHNKCLKKKIDGKPKYIQLESINSGGSCRIFQGIDRVDNNVVVLKELETQFLKKVYREINILHILRKNDNIINLNDYFEKKGKHYLVFPYINSDNTRKHIYLFTKEKILVFFKKLVETVNFIHSKKIIHRDLKPGNIIFVSNEPENFKIIDFGISDYYIPFRKYATLNGTKNFKSPEQLFKYSELDYGIDVWALGIIFLEGVTKMLPFFSVSKDSNSDVEMMKKIIILCGYDNVKMFTVKYDLEFPKELEKFNKFLGFDLIRYLSYFKKKEYDYELPDIKWLELIKMMMEVDPEKRITCPEILEKIQNF